MRISSLPGAAVRHVLPSTACALLLAVFPAWSRAVDFTAVPDANLDLSQLGEIGFVGDFSAISLYQYEGQSEDGGSSNGTQGVLSQLPNGAYVTLALSDADIEAMCPFVLKNGTLSGIVVGGNFTSLGGVESQGIAMLNPTTTEVTALPGISGQVSALLCDQDTNSVYVGGNFAAENSSNAIAWVGTEGWSNLPFEGFNGPVTSITKASNGNIIFGGSFTGLGNSSADTSSQSTSNDTQIIAISSGNISATASTSTDGFSDPNNIVCQTNGTDGAGTTWLLEDNTAGAWTAEFGFGFRPTKLRLYNTHYNGRGTQTFRYTAFPINGIMNLTYTDPDSGDTKYCDSQCTMSSNSSVEFQDFHFVNVIGMDGFQIDISAWYGDGGGLNGIELFEDDIFSYAISEFNEPACADLTTASSSTTTGSWAVTPSHSSTSEYLTAVTDDDSPSVTFYPDIKESGNYSVNMYTPGCIQDDTCDTRGQVTINGTMSSSGDAFSTTIFQTNNYDKYDQIYFGYVDVSSSSFRPSVTISSATTTANQTIVAQRVGFTLVSGSDGLNGLFEMNPSSTTVSTSDINNSTVDQAGTNLDTGAEIKALAAVDDSIFVAGNFSGDSFSNIFEIDSSGVSSLTSGGLNGEVLALYVNGTTLYVGGDFSDTSDSGTTGLSNVAVYDTSAKSWAALGAGVDGPVHDVVPLYLNVTSDSPVTTIAISGDFGEISAFDDNDAISVSGFAIWVPSENNWLNNLNASTVSINGQLSVETNSTAGSFLAGSIDSQSLKTNGAAALSESAISAFPIEIQSSTESSSSVSKRDLTSNVTGVVTGLFYDENDLNITILGGQFSATATNGSTVNNLVFINGSNSDTVTGIGSEIDSSSIFRALETQSGILYAGGSLSGTVKDSSIGGLITYNLATAAFNSQPPALSGSDETVYAITAQDSTGDVYVAGSFENAGSLDCPAVCVFTTSASQWNRPGTALTDGTAQALLWASSTSLIVGGTLMINNANLSLATYNTKAQTWAEFDGASAIPGAVTSLVAANSDASEIWISGTASNGSAYLMKYDGSTWNSVVGLGDGTEIRGLQVFSLSKSHDSTDLVSSSQALMLTGMINLLDFGNASAVLYNGTAFQPYALTTTSSNEAGTIAQVFSQKQNFFSTSGKHLAIGFVVLIGLAISLGLIFLIVVAGVLAERIRRKREGYVKAPTNMYDTNSMFQRLPPENLLGTVNQGRAAADRAPVI